MSGNVNGNVLEHGLDLSCLSKPGFDGSTVLTQWDNNNNNNLFNISIRSNNVKLFSRDIVVA